MKKQFWLRLDPSTPDAEKTEFLKKAEECCSVAILSDQDLALAAGLKLRTASTDDRAEIKLLPDPSDIEGSEGHACAVELTVKEAADEQKALQLAEKGVRYLIVKTPNWKIIPLENLIARTRNKATLIADVSDLQEAKLALQTLEVGVDGVAMSPKSINDIEQMSSILNQLEESILFQKGKVVSVKTLGTGVRVCVDTIELLEPGEGLLVGSQSAGMLLIEAEVHSNPHVEPRPFRVNAGPVSSYVLTPGLRTRYLSELKAGDEVLLVKRTGTVRRGHIGRVKMERRPMTLIETEANGRVYAIIVQNAETVRLVTDSDSTPVSELKPGDEVLIKVEEGGRHFGTLVADEMVIER
jgi:3-dehydroquinate synthase II